MPLEPEVRSVASEDIFDFPRIELAADGLRANGVLVEPHSELQRSVSEASSAAFPRARALEETARLPQGDPKSGGVAFEPTPPSSDSTTARGDARARRSLVLARTAAGVLVLVNAGLLAALWRTHESFGASIAGLRTELARNTLADRDTTRAPLAPRDPPAPVEIPERVLLRSAADDIARGDAASARRRLGRLLARIDSVEPAVRAEVEPEALYLLAESWEHEADSRRGRSP